MAAKNLAPICKIKPLDSRYILCAILECISPQGWKCLAVTFGSNIAALKAQRRLAEGTASVSRSFERLSSGLRINRAGDDAAGLSVSSALFSGARVFTQATRNLNDGVSLLNIAEGALGELSAITMRQKELATQAANGSYSLQQRVALNTEANSLVDEFNRIIQSTSFNGRNVLDRSITDLRIQAGYGTTGGISFLLTNQLSRTVGDGTFQSAVSYASGTDPSDIVTADFDSDGILDLIVSEYNGAAGASLMLRSGNGDGTFKAVSTITIGSGPFDLSVGDLNNDGKQDVVIAYDAGVASFVLGNGNGTFKANQNLSASLDNTTLVDVNNDGYADITGAGEAGGVHVFLNNGNGTFKASVSYSASSSFSNVTAGDFNGDGNTDLAAATDTSIVIHFGAGNGQFGATTSFTTGGGGGAVCGDFNRDGKLDISATYGTSIVVSLGNGNGTFRAGVTYAFAGDLVETPIATDMNGDGSLDLILPGKILGSSQILLGNSDGTFRSGAAITGSTSLVCGDFNRDGAVDLAGNNYYGTETNVFLANSTKVTTSPYLNITTRQGALEALSTLDSTLQRINSELGAIGSTQSRFQSALNTLGAAQENYAAAGSRIVDADIAGESAIVVRSKILQNAASAVLAQANQAPAVALQLLKS